MMIFSSVITLMTGDVTQPMSPTMSTSRRRSARRTSERVVSSSMSRLPSMRQSMCAELLWLRIVISRDQRFAELSMSLNVGLNRRSMKLRTMLLIVRLKMRKSVSLRLLATPPLPSAPNGPRKSALSPRSQSRNTLPSLDVPRSQEKSVDLLDVIQKGHAN